MLLIIGAFVIALAWDALTSRSGWLWTERGRYGLTIMRILPLWLMAWLAAMTVLAAVRLFRPKLPMLRMAAVSLVY